MIKELDSVLTVEEAVSYIIQTTKKPISSRQVRQICKDTADGKLKGKHSIKAELKGKTWLISLKSLQNFERLPLGPKGPRIKLTPTSNK